MNYLSKENVQEVLDLSLLQESILLQESSQPDVGTNLSQVSYTLQNVDSAQFQQAWEQVIPFHPSLRVVFRVVRNRTVQVVLKTRPVPVEVHDLRGQSEMEQHAVIEQKALAERAPFNVGEGPLMRLTLFVMSEQQAVFVWTYHHLILDRYSQELVFGDLLAVYDSLANGAEVAMISRRPYKEYLTWVTDQDWMLSKEFWTAQLADFEVPTALLDGQRPSADRKAEAHVAATRLTRELSQGLEALAQRNRVSSSTLAHAAWALLLNVYSGEESVTYGVTSLGRPSGVTGSDEMIGRFLNTLPAQVQVDGQKQLGAFLNGLHEQYKTLMEYAYLPLAEVRSYGGMAGEQELFASSLAVYQAMERTSTLQVLATEKRAPTLEQTLEIEVRLGDEWEIEFVYANGTLSADTVARMQSHLVTVLESMVNQPDALVSELNVLPADERQKLFVAFNRCEIAAPSLELLAHQVIELQVAQSPDAIAVTCGTEQVTYAELNTRANRLAHWLRTQGFGRDDLAALLMERSVEMLVAIVAVLKAGGAYVPLDSAHPDNRLIVVIENSGAKVIFTQDDHLQRGLALANSASQQPVVYCANRGTATSDVAGVQTVAAYSDANLASVNLPHDLANVFFTSGSTGLPKGAMIEHIGMLNHLYAKINLLGLTDKSVVVQNASHCFDISVWQFLAPLMVGGQVVIYVNDESIDPQVLFAHVQRDRATVLEMVPAMIEMFLVAASDRSPEERALPALAYMVSTGEGLPVALLNKWLRAYPQIRVVNTYGATECSDDTSHKVIDTAHDEADHYVTLGTPIANFKTYVLDRWLRPVPIGCAGEICLTGVGVGRGYLNDPEKTAAAFVKNPFDDGMGERMYRTGDVGRYLPTGDLAFISRIDHQVKVRGHRIELGEIESVLLEEANVSQCVAIVRVDSAGQNRILTYVVGEGLHIASLRELIHENLPEYMVPEHIIVLDAMPLNRNGKVDLKALPDPDDSTRSEAEFTAPRTAIETTLARIWEEVLEVYQLGIDDNFFALGGHSLKTIQVRSRIKQRFGFDVPLRTLFDSQTIRDLAPLMEQMQSESTDSEHQMIPRLPDTEYYPMSNSQRRLYFLHKLEPQNCSYNMPVIYRIEGELDVAALHRTFQTITDRHSALRTTFHLIDGQPVQQVVRDFTLLCPVTDLSARDDRTCQQQLDAKIETEMSTPFDLTTGPVFRVGVVKLTNNQHVLIVNMHHIVSDGWSWTILLREFHALYMAYSTGKALELPPLSIQYTDYSHWQNQRLENGMLAEEEAYWLHQLSGELPVLELPTDHPRQPIRQAKGRNEKLVYDAKLCERINQFCLQSDTTLFMVLLSAASAFLYRMSGQEDLIIGTPEAGRNRVELEELIGFFINTLPLRVDLSGNPTFLELLERAKKTALDAYVHQEYPFDQMVDRLNPVRDMSRAPITSVMFSVNRVNAVQPTNGLHLQKLPLEEGGVGFDLTISFAERSGNIECYFEYSSDLFEATTIHRWMSQLETIIQGIMADPEQRIASLPMLSKEEREQIVVGWNDTKREEPLDRCVHQLFEAQVEKTPNAVAVVFEEQQFTYRELNDRANQLAHYLKQQGAGTESLIGLCIERSIDMVVGVLGILKAGAAYLPMDPAFPEERLAFMLEDANVSLLVTEQSLKDHLTAKGLQTICLDAEREHIAQATNTNPQSNVTSDKLAYVIYTSGSTGQPKGVQIEHRSVVNFLYSMQTQPGITAQDTLVSVTTLSFDIAALELFLPLTVGARLVVVSREVAYDGSKLLAVMNSVGVTVMQATPATWRLLLEADWEGHAQLKVLCGGEALPRELADQLVKRSGTLWNMYGPTEATIWSAVHQVEAGNISSIGKPIANTQIYLLDSELQPVSVGVAGELFIGGAGLARGYLNRPELTAEKFIPHLFDQTPGARLYRTGDLARYLSNGTIEYLSRVDHQVKLRGYRMELGEIEAVLEHHPSVSEAVVIVREDVPGDKQLVAYLVEAAEATVSFAEMRSHLLTKLPDYMVPTTYVVLEALPLTPNGKVDRKNLPTPDGFRSAQESYVPPRDLLEMEMAKIWEEILQVKPIGAYDNYFALGGNSLKALSLMGAIRKRFDLELPLTALFRTPTIAEICDYFRGNTTLVPEILVPIQQGEGDRAPLFIVHPHGGGVMSYFHLARTLGREETVYGLQAVGYESDELPLHSIEEQADCYVEEIRRVAPQGPYRLAGWSFGGMVAYEMARRLEACGEAIEFLGLIDVHPFGLEGEMQVERIPLEAPELVQYAMIMGLDENTLTHLPENEAHALLLRQAKELKLLPEIARVETMWGKLQVILAHSVAMTQYRSSGIITSDIHLFCASEISEVTEHTLVEPEPWRKRTSGQVHVVKLPGDHTSILEPPHVAVLAEQIKMTNGREAVVPSSVNATN